MKQAYSKPVLILESFTMTQTIAHNCGDNLDFSMATTKYKASCGWNLGADLDGVNGNDILWNNGVDGSACNANGSDMSVLCYNNPSGGYNIFNS